MFKELIKDIGTSFIISAAIIYLKNKYCNYFSKSCEIVKPVIENIKETITEVPKKCSYNHFERPRDLNKEFLCSYLWRFRNLKRWIDPFKSAGLYTIWDVYENKGSIKYFRNTIPGIGDKGEQILLEIANLVRDINLGYTRITWIGDDINLKCLNYF